MRYQPWSLERRLPSRTFPGAGLQLYYLYLPAPRVPALSSCLAAVLHSNLFVLQAAWIRS